jgi:uncharacterized damage-inducible protein DinB
MSITNSRKKNIVDLKLSSVPEIGSWLWAVEDCRQRTIESLADVSPAVVDWQPAAEESSMGTILYHIAAIEADWLYVEVLEQDFPPAVTALFAHEIRDEQGQLTQVSGMNLEQHLNRLEIVRGLLLDAYQQMDLTDFRRVRIFPHYDVTPEWVLHHLMQHEAEHRSQMAALRVRAQRTLEQQ